MIDVVAACRLSRACRHRCIEHSEDGYMLQPNPPVHFQLFPFALLHLKMVEVWNTVVIMHEVLVGKFLSMKERWRTHLVRRSQNS